MKAKYTADMSFFVEEGRLPLAVVKVERFDPLRKIETNGVKK